MTGVALFLAGTLWLGFLLWLSSRRRALAGTLIVATQALLVGGLAVWMVRDGDALSSLFVGVMVGLLLLRGLDKLDGAFMRRGGRDTRERLHVFTFPAVPGWKPASPGDMEDLALDLAQHGTAYATDDGHRVDPRTVTVRHGEAYGGRIERRGLDAA